MRNRFNLKIISMLLVGLLLALSATSAYAEPTLDELQSEYDKKQENIKKTNEKIDANKAQQGVVASKIGEVDQRIVVANAEVLRLGQELDITVSKRQETERQLSQIQAELDITLKQLDEAKKQLARYKSVLGERLRNVYKNGKSSYLEIILKSVDFGDLMNRLSFIKMIASQDSRLVRDTQQTKQSIEIQEAEQQRQKSAVDVKRATILAEEQRISYLKTEQDSQKTAAQAERNQREALVDELKQDQAALEALAAQEEADAAALAARMHSWGKIIVSRTGWVWPTGTMADISSYFGPRDTGIPGASRNHKGIDIAVDYGTPVYAANNGVIEDTGYFGTYGLYISINHGEGYGSAYAHLQAVAVDSGQSVTAGQVIGYVGSTGNSSGPHLHFEILVDGVQQNPLQWY